MDPDRERQLDQILERTRARALKSLEAVVDVDERLRELHRAAAAAPRDDPA